MPPRRRKSKDGTPLPPWPLDRKLVVCVNGPRANGWYFLEDWHEQRRLAEWSGETPYTGRTLGYVPVRDETMPHPEYPTVTGHVLAWSPDTAASALEKRGTSPTESNPTTTGK